MARVSLAPTTRAPASPRSKLVCGNSPDAKKMKKKRMKREMRWTHGWVTHASHMTASRDPPRSGWGLNLRGDTRSTHGWVTHVVRSRAPSRSGKGSKSHDDARVTLGKQMRANTSTSSSFKQQFLRISYEELLRAADKFSETNLIGKGRYGMVSKGILGCGITVTVKILRVCSSVDIRGNDFKALRYEFMANESLEEWLHPGTIGPENKHGESRSRRFTQRLNIAINIATTIEYLHKGCSLAVIHGDLKPKYGMGHNVSMLGDAYNYGILLLQMFTRKRPTKEAFEPHFNLHSFVMMAVPGRAIDVIDLRLLSATGDQQQEFIIRDCSTFILEVGLACLMGSPRDRMDMTEVVKELHSIRESYETKQRSTRM
ncbi:probable LRR receptor-like serine/threonine-protein kinase At3g47570 [Rhodamnia argentea]|uniref:Probable LRR receptor-like serine/threonine-protein kinase At3g47570 n=1 Tax=Rhodamnia argentea TaxID=178133 RepID=A0ABM3HG82_9MYRT|nr:probable LRR receptor-like serine/threonine-protein kinase At3g47570 [Rhodamnia argentea]